MIAAPVYVRRVRALTCVLSARERERERESGLANSVVKYILILKAIGTRFKG